MCGKNYGLTNKVFAKAGSPPRVREKLENILIHPYYLGITPACAGKTKTDEEAFVPASGSPPRVREKH